MKNSFAATVAFLELFILLLWEAVGGLYFGWPPLAILLVWFAGFWTIKIATASVLHTFIRLTSPPAEATPVETAAITEDDLG